jgi:hypothetical protein
MIFVAFMAKLFFVIFVANLFVPFVARQGTRDI